MRIYLVNILGDSEIYAIIKCSISFFYTFVICSIIVEKYCWPYWMFLEEV